MSGLLITIIILLVLVIPNANAHLGMRPAKIEADFKPEGELYVNYYVDTTPETPIKIYAIGDFSEYVSFSKEEFIGSGSFIATVNLPQEAAKPGPNKLYIRAA